MCIFFEIVLIMYIELKHELSFLHVATFRLFVDVKTKTSSETTAEICLRVFRQETHCEPRPPLREVDIIQTKKGCNEQTLALTKTTGTSPKT